MDIDKLRQARIFSDIDEQSIELYNRNLDAIKADIEAMEQLRESMPHKSKVIDLVIEGLRREYRIVFRRLDT